MNRAGLPRWADIVLVPLANILLAFCAAGLLVLAIGESPLQVVRVMLEGALGSAEAIG